MIEEPKAPILLVDDKPENLLALEATLAPLGEPIVSVRSGGEALKCLLTQEFAVILLDVQMAGMDGFETARLVRERDESMHTPIIFLTAYSKTDEQVSHGYKLGAVDYLFKPIVPEVVRAKVSALIELFKKTETGFEELRAFAAPKPLVGWEHGSVTAQAVGVGPLRERSMEAFVDVQSTYEGLLDQYLEALGFDHAPPRQAISALAHHLGDHGAGPRDVIDVHSRAVSAKCRDAGARRARAYSIEGRLLALEVMGYLVDHYRLQRNSSGGKTS